MIPLIMRLTGLSRGLSIALSVLGAAALLWGAKALYDHQVIARYNAKVEAQAAKARDVAADERAADAVTTTRHEEELHHVIETASSGGAISPAAHALACERLRHLGRHPAACGPDGGSGSQANPK